MISFALLALFAVGAGWFGSRLPSGFLPEEDQGYIYMALQLPDAASLERTDAACHKIEDLLSQTPGVQYTTSIIGFNLVSLCRTTYSAFFFVTLKPWSERTKPEEQYEAIKMRLTKELAGLTDGIAFAFPPPAIPGVGTSGGFTLCAGRSLRERYWVPGAKRGQVRGSRAQTSGDRRHDSGLFARMSRKSSSTSIATRS